MVYSSSKRLNLMGRTTILQESPVLHELLLVELGPGFDEPLLPSGKDSGQSFDRVDTVDDHVVLVVRMKVRTVMLLARLRVHPDDDAKEP
jgi:hypothetical protein